MTSEKQIIANRKNGLLGGVKTLQGKALVRLNAVTHGLLCQDVLVKGENHSQLVEFRNRFLDELQPQGQLEMVLVERVISSTWRLKRAPAKATSTHRWDWTMSAWSCSNRRSRGDCTSRT